MNVRAPSVIEPLQLPYYYYKKSQIKKTPKCVISSSSSTSVTSLVLESNQENQQTSTSTQNPTAPLLSVAARRLILLRHAKSSWKDRSIRDHDRPLSRTGKLDAIKLSQNLLKLGWIPQLILSSDALRTRETLKIMQEQVQAFLEAEVHFISSFYSVAAMDGQTAEHLRQAICKYSRDEISTVMCMGHNRGWEEAASVLSGVTVELKTCNAALLEATGKSWEVVNLLALFSGVFSGWTWRVEASRACEARHCCLDSLSVKGIYNQPLKDQQPRKCRTEAARIYKFPVACFEAYSGTLLPPRQYMPCMFRG